MRGIVLRTVQSLPPIRIEPLEPRMLLTGVTLIAHGFGGSAAGWETTMGQEIAEQSGPLATQPMYLMTLTDPGHDGGPLSIATTRLGPTYANWGSHEIIVLLDWSDVAGSLPFGGYHRTTQDCGTAVANQFLMPYSIPDLATPLAELPIDLIGHSRGASLISEMARVLGEHGVWVDQATYLDPHPVDGIRDPFNINFGDAAMKVYDNVQYADDFWRTAGDTSLDFTGEPVTGAYNLQLSESILSNGGYSIQHSDTHLWYNGTIGPPFSDTDGGATIGTGWYDPPQGPRNQVGWHMSRLAGGTREPDGLKSDGAHRDAVTLSVSGANLWDNIEISNLVSNLTLTSGTTIPVSVSFEDKTAAQGGARDSTITIGLDRDDNPYNGVFNGVSSLAANLASDSFNTSLDTSGISGAYHVYAKITNGVNTRYYYARGEAIVVAAGFTKTWIGPPTGGSWSLTANWTSAGAPSATDAVSIFASSVILDTTATTKIAQLDLQGGAALNLHNHNLVIDYTGSSPVATIRSQLITGRKREPNRHLQRSRQRVGGFADTWLRRSRRCAASHRRTDRSLCEHDRRRHVDPHPLHLFRRR